MGSAGGDEQERLLDEQVSYYRALAPDYLDQGLDLPGGDELTEALEAFRPTGSVLELACGPGVWTGQLLRHATDVTAVDASPEMLAIAAAGSAVNGCASFRPICSPGRLTAVMTWFSSASGSRTYRSNALRPSGHWWPTA